MFPPDTSQSCTYMVLGLPICVTRQLFPLASVGLLQCHPQKPFANLSFCSGLAPGSLAKKDASMANTKQRTESPILAFAHSPSLGARTEDVRLPNTLKLNEDNKGTPSCSAIEATRPPVLIPTQWLFTLSRATQDGQTELGRRCLQGHRHQRPGFWSLLQDRW